MTNRNKRAGNTKNRLTLSVFFFPGVFEMRDTFLGCGDRRNHLRGSGKVTAATHPAPMGSRLRQNPFVPLF
jgi:hypothetical protein